MKRQSTKKTRASSVAFERVSKKQRDIKREEETDSLNYELLANIECLQHKPLPNTFSSFQYRNFIMNLNVLNYLHCQNEEQKNDFLKDVDAIKLFKACQDLDQELSIKRVESYYIKEHIKDTEPKLLNRLKERKTNRLPLVDPFSTRSSADESRKEIMKDVDQHMLNHLRINQASFKADSDTESHTMSHSRSKGKSIFYNEYRINHKTKISMMEKATVKLELNIKNMEKEAVRDMMEVLSKSEDLRLTRKEVIDTVENFKLHFLKDPSDCTFLVRANERELAMKFRTYVSKYLNAGRTLLGRTRLTDSFITQNIKTLKGEYRHKADLSHYLGEIDFEQLFIKKQQLSTILEDKSGQLAGIKKIAAKAQMSMADQKRNLDNNKNNLILLRRKNSELTDTVNNLEKVASIAKTANEKLELELNDMNEELEKYKAPSVAEYIELQRELYNLEKEEKILLRKMNIMNMRYQSVLGHFLKLKAKHGRALQNQNSTNVETKSVSSYGTSFDG